MKLRQILECVFNEIEKHSGIYNKTMLINELTSIIKKFKSSNTNDFENFIKETINKLKNELQELKEKYPFVNQRLKVKITWSNGFNFNKLYSTYRTKDEKNPKNDFYKKSTEIDILNFILYCFSKCKEQIKINEDKKIALNKIDYINKQIFENNKQEKVEYYILNNQNEYVVNSIKIKLTKREAEINRKMQKFKIFFVFKGDKKNKLIFAGYYDKNEEKFIKKSLKKEFSRIFKPIDFELTHYKTPIRKSLNPFRVKIIKELKKNLK